MTRLTQSIASAFITSALLSATGCQSSSLPGPAQTDISESGDDAFPAADIQSADAAAALSAIEVARSAVADNLSNKETTAYKASVVRVQSGGKLTGQLDMTEGRLENTGSPLDLAIHGPGFFKVRDQSFIGGVAFARNGNFVINKDGELVLNVGDGCRLLPPLVIPPNAIKVTIGSDGVVSVLLPGQTASKTVGQVMLSRFASPEFLVETSGSLYCETASSGMPVDDVPSTRGPGQLQQGFLEASNVDAKRETHRLRFLDDWHRTLAHAAGIDDGKSVTDKGDRK